MYQLNPCPYCGKQPIFIRESSRVESYGLAINFIILCDDCGTVVPEEVFDDMTVPRFHIAYKLQPNGEIVLVEDDREKAVEMWNQYSVQHKRKLNPIRKRKPNSR